MHKRNLLVILFLIVVGTTGAQEIQSRITVVSSKISTKVDKKVFTTLQTALTNFVNNRKWTNDAFLQSEKIECNFLITLENDDGNDTYDASLTVQAARPIYNTTYQSPLINYQDDKFTFRYVEFQPMDFNENRVQGSDPVAANLTATFAYYIYIILGMDYDSYSLRGGDPYFQKAWNIVHNAPESGTTIKGWKQFDGLRNRYFLAENVTDSRHALIHDALYAYYRTGLDNFYDDETSGRSGILNCLNFLSTMNQEMPNSMIMQIFFQGKSTELIKLFSKATPDVKKRAVDLLTKLDINNASAYKELK
jgi:uncharacterized protein DUF4835